MRICVLSMAEAGRLENYGIEPVHTHHVHIDVKDAIDRLKADTLRIVEPYRARSEKQERLRWVTEPTSNSYRWRKRLSAGVSTMQLSPIR